MSSTTGQTPLRGVVPYLTVQGAKDAVAFYQKAFGAREIRRMDADDGVRLLHCHLQINGADVLMSDHFPEFSGGKAPTPVGVTLHLAVDDADAWWDRAVAAGATPIMPLEDQFWGDRYGQIRDPFGHRWSIGAPIRR